MNEQQLADLFSTQIDHLLAGETVTTPVNELSGLLGLGQQLAGINFQPSLAVQTAFQGQLTNWFGPAAGGVPAPTILGLPKAVFIAVSAAVVAGLGLLALLGIVWSGLLNKVEPTPPINTPPAFIIPTTVEPVWETPVPTVPSVTETPSAGPTRPAPVGDTVPIGKSSAGDTIPITPTPTQETPILSGTPTLTPTLETGDGVVNSDNGDNGINNDDGGNNLITGDHDRGHGNDADHVDEDNPGKSSGSKGGGKSKK